AEQHVVYAKGVGGVVVEELRRLALMGVQPVFELHVNHVRRDAVHCVLHRLEPIGPVQVHYRVHALSRLGVGVAHHLHLVALPPQLLDQRPRIRVDAAHAIPAGDHRDLHGGTTQSLARAPQPYTRTVAIATDVKTYQNYIAGEWTGAGAGQPLEITNPVNGELVYRALSATESEVDAAVAAARNALETTDWAENPERRAIALRKLSDALKGLGKDLARLLSQEAGKLFPVSLNEVNRGADALAFYSGLARAIYGRTTTLNPDSLAIMLREPVGVVGIIVPWNMALSLLTRPMAPAL